jgi:uncharacterized BrkB/YihY/UPF0761 family membrane protein
MPLQKFKFCWREIWQSAPKSNIVSVCLRLIVWIFFVLLIVVTVLVLFRGAKSNL